jgi:hypothetical protein
MQLKLGTVALTPETAVRTMLNNRGVINNFQIVQKQLTPAGTLVVYNYIRHQAMQPPILVFGYALVTLRVGGWSVNSANLAKVSLSDPVSYATTSIGNDLLVYGYVSNAHIAAIEATVDTGAVMKLNMAHNGFSGVVAHAHSVRELRVMRNTQEILATYNLPTVVQQSNDE